MTPRRVLGLAQVAMVAMLAVPLLPAVATTPSALVLTGSRTASVDLVLSRPARLEPHRLRFTTTGSYAGIAVLDASGEALLTSVNVRRWVEGATPAPDPVSTSREVDLPAGRYRVVLLTDGASTVTVPATGALARRLAPRGATSATAMLVSARDAVGTVDVRLPTVLRRGGAVSLTQHVRTTAEQAHETQTCFAAPGAADCTGSDGTLVASSSPGEVGERFTQVSVFLYGDDLTEGRYDALVQGATLDVPKVHDALLVVV